MGRWQDRVTNHGAVQQLDQIQTRLSELEAESPDEAETLSRASQVVGHVHARVADAEPGLITPNMLQRLQAPGQQILQHLNEFAQSRTPASLTNVSDQLDALLDAATPLPERSPEVVPEDVIGTVERLRSLSRDVQQAAQQRLEEVTAEVGRLREEVQNLRATQQQRVETFSEKVNELEGSLEELRGQAGQLIETQQQAFSQAQQQHSRAIHQALDEMRQRHETSISALEDLEEEARANWKQEAQRLVDEIKGKREETKKLVDAVGAIGTSGGFGRYASEQKETADEWRRRAFWVGLAAVVAGFVLFLLLGEDVLSATELAGRIAIVGALGAVAAYSGHQSARHRHREELARKADLELAALEPYIALFDDDDKRAVKKEFAQRFFGQPLEPLATKHSDEPVLSQQTLGVIKDLGAAFRG